MLQPQSPFQSSLHLEPDIHDFFPSTAAGLEHLERMAARYGPSDYHIAILHSAVGLWFTPTTSAETSLRALFHACVLRMLLERHAATDHVDENDIIAASEVAVAAVWPGMQARLREAGWTTDVSHVTARDAPLMLSEPPSK